MTRKEKLSGIAEQKRDLEYNQKIKSAAEQAQLAVSQLIEAQSKLAEVQLEQASAAREAAEQMKQLAGAKEQIAYLEQRANMIKSIVFRLSVRGSATNKSSSGFLSNAVPRALLITNRGVSFKLVSDGTLETNFPMGARTYLVDYRLESPDSFVNRDVSELSRVSILEIELNDFLKGADPEAAFDPELVEFTSSVNDVESVRVQIVNVGNQFRELPIQLDVSQQFGLAKKKYSDAANMRY